MNISIDLSKLSSWQKELLIWGIGFFIVSILILLRFNRLPPQVPLVFFQKIADEKIIKITDLIILPLLSFLIVNINNLIAKKMNDVFFENFIFWFDICFIISCQYLLLRIILLVS